MTVFSRFVVLACLCAVIPLAPPVEAAHLYGSHSMEKHGTTSHSPHPTHKHPPLDGSSMEHKHEDKHDENHTHGHQRAGLPPLLRRYRFHGHSNAHYQDHHPHHIDDKNPRSAFARNRYRREPSSHSRRSSVYVPGEHGNTYIVSGTPPGHGKHTYDRRQTDEADLASGRIDIMGDVQSPGSTQRLASLTVDSTPVDWMSGQSSGKAFPLNASTTNQTQFIMVPTDDPNADGSTNRRVKLATEVFDAGGADMVMYCATYDANPGTPSALLMTPCSDTAQFEASNDATGPCADDEDDASSSSSRQSQIFSYDPFGGAIEPILATDRSSGGGSSSDRCAGAKVRRDTANSPSGSTTPSSTSTSSAPNPIASKHAQNVTLVYVAGALEVPAPSPSASVNTTTASATSTTSAHINQAAMVTTTVTTTVVTTVMASGGATPAEAVVSAPTSSLSASSTTSSRAVATTPANANESLEVEVVGVTPSTTTDSSSTSASGTATSSPSSSPSSSHSSASPSPNAEAVASSVAKQMPHQRRAIAIASASIV